MMKKYIICGLALMIAIIVKAESVSFTISDGIDNAVIKSKMETSVTRILNEVNSAQAEGRNLNFSVMGVNINVQQSMAMLWENAPFICTDEEIVEHCITTGSGYQVRNIPLLMKPTGEREFNEDEYQEAVISFDKQGNVVSFYLTVSLNLYKNIIKSNLGVTDLRRRQMILEYVEQFRTAYNQKNIHFLNQVFSDDALIITGTVITVKHAEGFSSQKIRYNKQNKEEYLNRLKGVFARNQYIKVDFDDIEVMRSPINTDFYGVLLKQWWTAGRKRGDGGEGYHDEGYVFLLWDFSNENAPQIHVRTWQPDMLNGKPLPDEDKFNLNDFNIQKKR